MARSSSAHRGVSAGPAFVLQKPSGELTPRVKAVGPDHFGLLCFDCAKDRSRFFLADFYGQVLLEPATLPHTQSGFQAAIERVREAVRRHALSDLAVAIERTGDYHRPVQRAFREAGFDTRIVHPYTTKQYRQPAHPDDKTDDHDLAAIFRAAAHGFGLCEATWPADYTSLQILRRHRRDLVDKNSILMCQILEKLHAAMPGYAGCFGCIWESPVALAVARRTTSAAAVRQLGLSGLQELVDQQGLRCRKQTLANILAWSEQAPPGHDHSLELRLVLGTLEDDRSSKCKQINELERQLAGLIVKTPYTLLLAIPGINVVTVADLAGELGPIELYRDANAITGRAGLMPSRYQSDRVDRADGRLRRRGNRRLRGVLMQTADNLVQCNHYFRAQAEQWRRAGKAAPWIRVKVAKRFSRLAYAVVAGKQLFSHPCSQEGGYVLEKLLRFHSEHGTQPAVTRQGLESATEQLPASSRQAEAKPLQERLEEMAGKKRGVRTLEEIIPFVLARLGVKQIECPGEGTGLS
jgi:transposase